MSKFVLLLSPEVAGGFKDAVIGVYALDEGPENLVIIKYWIKKKN